MIYLSVIECFAIAALFSTVPGIRILRIMLQCLLEREFIDSISNPPDCFIETITCPVYCWFTCTSKRSSLLFILSSHFFRPELWDSVKWSGVLTAVCKWDVRIRDVVWDSLFWEPADGEQTDAVAADSSVGPQIKTSSREWKQADVDGSTLLFSDERCTLSSVQLGLLNTNILL